MKKAKVLLSEQAEERVSALSLASLVFLNGYISALETAYSRSLERDMFGKEETKGEDDESGSN